MYKKWIALILIVIIIWAVMYKTSIFVIDKFVYEPSVYFSDSDIYKYGKVGERPLFFSTIPRVIEKSLLEHPYVKYVSISKKFPDTLVLDIKYREEFLAIFYSGLYVTLDSEMTVLKVEESIGDIFLVDGFEFESYKVGGKLKVKRRSILIHIIQLIQLIKKSHIESKPYIRYDEGIELYINDEYRVLFGQGYNIEDKFNDFVAVYDNLSEMGVNSGTIDVGHDGPPIYRPFGR